jgi:hypothetical protein
VGGRQAKRAAKPTPDYVALVERGHVQRAFGLEVEAEVMKGKMIVRQTVIFTG